VLATYDRLIADEYQTAQRQHGIVATQQPRLERPCRVIPCKQFRLAIRCRIGIQKFVSISRSLVSLHTTPLDTRRRRSCLPLASTFALY
jgi:hypothetical protein